MKKKLLLSACMACAASVVLLTACSTTPGGDASSGTSSVFSSQAGESTAGSSSLQSPAASSGSGKTQEENLAEKLSTTVPFANPLEPIDSDRAMEMYGLTEEDVAGVAAYVGTGGATADEISVWKAKSAASVKIVEEKVKARVAAQKEGYADYRPEEVPKLDDPVLVIQGDLVILCVSEDNQAAKQVIDRFAQ